MLKKLNKIIAMLFVANTSNAQIVYTNVIPDFAGSSANSYTLDLNNDLINDFSINIASGSVIFSVFNLNQFSGANHPTIFYIGPYAYSSGTSIDASLSSWSSGSSGIMSISGDGFWNNASDKFVALKLKVGSNTYYGWVRLDVNSTASAFVVKDYAYNSIANQPILAGQTSSSTTGIFEAFNTNDFTISPQPASDIVNVVLPKGANNLTIIDINGKIVYNENLYNVSFKSISTGNLNNGIYFISINFTNNKPSHSKLIIQRN